MTTQKQKDVLTAAVDFMREPTPEHAAKLWRKVDRYLDPSAPSRIGVALIHEDAIRARLAMGELEADIARSFGLSRQSIRQFRKPLRAVGTR
jgi:hypothetical protein